MKTFTPKIPLRVLLGSLQERNEIIKIKRIFKVRFSQTNMCGEWKGEMAERELIDTIKDKMTKKVEIESIWRK